MDLDENTKQILNFEHEIPIDIDKSSIFLSDTEIPIKMLLEYDEKELFCWNEKKLNSNPPSRKIFKDEKNFNENKLNEGKKIEENKLTDEKKINENKLKDEKKIDENFQENLLEKKMKQINFNSIEDITKIDLRGFNSEKIYSSQDYKAFEKINSEFLEKGTKSKKFAKNPQKSIKKEINKNSDIFAKNIKQKENFKKNENSFKINEKLENTEINKKVENIEKFKNTENNKKVENTENKENTEKLKNTEINKKVENNKNQIFLTQFSWLYKKDEKKFGPANILEILKIIKTDKIKIKSLKDKYFIDLEEIHEKMKEKKEIDGKELINFYEVKKNEKIEEINKNDKNKKVDNKVNKINNEIKEEIISIDQRLNNCKRSSRILKKLNFSFSLKNLFDLINNKKQKESLILIRKKANNSSILESDCKDLLDTFLEEIGIQVLSDVNKNGFMISGRK